MRIAHEIELRPVLAALCAKSSDRRRIDQLAGSLALAAVFSRSVEFNVGHMIGKTKSLVALRQLNKHVAQVITQIDGLGTEAQQMLEKCLTLDEGIAKIEVLNVLAKLSKASAAAHGVIKGWQHSPGRNTKPKKFASRNVARKAYEIFEELTGVRPTIPAKNGRAYGKYLIFLKDVFSILDIRDSPEAAGREIIKEKRVAQAN